MRSSSSGSIARFAATALLCVSLVLPTLAQARGDGPGNGPSAAPAPSGPGTAGAPPVGANGAEASISNLSRSAQQAIDACDRQKATTKCIADILDRFATELAEIAPQLPPPLRALPNIVATSARKVRAAKTKTEAVNAIREAIVAVHKSIRLVRADDPVSHQVATREGALVAATLEVAGAKLEKAVGL
jgi:hypothetical protein